MPKNKICIPSTDKLAIRWSMRNGFEECQICGTNEDLTFDHIIPKIRGGDNTIANLCILCATCNAAKGSRIVPNLKPLTELEPNVLKVMAYDLEPGTRTLHGVVEATGFVGNFKGMDMYAIEFSGENLLFPLMSGLEQRSYLRNLKKGNVLSIPGDRYIAIDPRYVLVGV